MAQRYAFGGGTKPLSLIKFEKYDVDKNGKSPSKWIVIEDDNLERLRSKETDFNYLRHQ